MATTDPAPENATGALTRETPPTSPRTAVAGEVSRTIALRPEWPVWNAICAAAERAVHEAWP